jgi:hypothetical protein
MVVFTVVTVIFVSLSEFFRLDNTDNIADKLPLSFFASFFALNIEGIQPVTMTRFWAFTGERTNARLSSFSYE